MAGSGGPAASRAASPSHAGTTGFQQSRDGQDMDPTVSEDDVGKRVENADGDQIGIAASVDDEAVYVEPNPGAIDSIKATLGWESDESDVVPVNHGVIGEVTPDAIRLDSELAVQGGTVGTASGTPPETGTDRSSGGAERAESDARPDTDAGGGSESTATDRSDASASEPPADPDLEVDPSELTDRGPESEIRSDEDVGDRSGYSDAPETDASLESAAEPRRSDDTVTSGRGGSGTGSTTEDAGRESGDVDPIADAERRPTEMDDSRAGAGERDDIGEMGEPAADAEPRSDLEEPRDLPDDASDIDEMEGPADREEEFSDERTDRDDRPDDADTTTDRSS